MLRGADVQTLATHEGGSDGMLGCSPGAGGSRLDGDGLTGGNPGEMGLWFCGGALSTMGSVSSLAVLGTLGAGASGKASSLAEKDAAVENEGAAAGGKLRCALALAQASHVTPTRLRARLARLRSGLQCILEMPVLLRNRTKLRTDRSRCSYLLVTTENQTQNIRSEL
jgi:hypothetical protein